MRYSTPICAILFTLAVAIFITPVTTALADVRDTTAPIALPYADAATSRDLQGDDEADETLEFSRPLSLDEQETSKSDGASGTSESQSDASTTESEELAKKVANPVANLISVPLQSNFIWGGGFDIPNLPKPLRILHHIPGIGGRNHRLGILGGYGDRAGSGLLAGSPGRTIARLLNLGRAQDNRDQAFQYQLKIQPVIPITLNNDWNVISRTILPIYAQHDLIGTNSQGGLGDLNQSFFFSPKSGVPFIWGVGPVILVPTSTDHNLLGSYRWGLGPTAVILKQMHGFTVGALANQLWGFQRHDGRKNVNATYLQPFLTYTTKTATSFGIMSESTYDWNDKQWTIPLIPNISQIVKIGKLPVNLQLAGQYWVEKPDSGPDWGIRFQMQFLFPK
jgi:hypothetical protein